MQCKVIAQQPHSAPMVARHQAESRIRHQHVLNTNYVFTLFLYIYVSTPVLSIYEQMTYPSPSLSASVSLSSKYMNPWAIMPSMSHLVFMCSPMHADTVHTCSVIVQQIKPYAFSLIRTVQSTGKVLHIAVRTRV